MKKYVIDIVRHGELNAGSKAKADISDVLSTEDFMSLEIELKGNKISKLAHSLKEIYKFKKIINSSKEEKIFLFQYPVYQEILDSKLAEIISSGIIILLIHDIDSLRYPDKNKSLEEITRFNNADIIISHNSVMTSWLVEHGVKTPIINLEIFDYLNPYKFVDRDQNAPLVFAGNLNKSKFLFEWNLEKKIQLFGISDQYKFPSNTQYNGSFPPDELPMHLSGSFGLVWEGNLLDTGSGQLAEYTKFNNPHKASLYLSCGLPLIVWSESAVANFVKEYDCGLIVESLTDLDGILANLDEKDYKKLSINAEKVGKKINEGFYTRNALTKALNLLNIKEI